MLWKYLLCSCKFPLLLPYLTSRLVGVFLSFLIPETKRKTLEELTGEDHWLHMEVPANGDPNLSGSENEKAV